MDLARDYEMHLVGPGLGLFKNWVFIFLYPICWVLDVFEVLAVEVVGESTVFEDFSFEVEVTAFEHVLEDAVEVAKNEVQNLPLKLWLQSYVKFWFLNYTGLELELIVVKVLDTWIYLLA